MRECGRRRKLEALTPEGHLRQPADVFEVFALRLVHKGVGDAAPAGPSGASDAMDVGVGILGKVVVHDVADIVDVDAPRREVGRDERGKFSATESVEHALALALSASRTSIHA